MLYDHCLLGNSGMRIFKTFITSLFSLIIFSSQLVMSSTPYLPSVVVTIKPIHSLVACVTNGVLIPTLLTSDNVSAHTHSLTPNEVQTLLKADLVIWIGEAYEANMQQTIRKLIPQQKLITLGEIKDLTLYPYRSESIWEGEFKEAHKHQENHHHDHSIDGHLWLDPDNAIVIVQKLAEIFSHIDPKNTDHYQQNAAATVKRLKELDNALKKILQPVRQKPYMVYHDAVQYFDRHFGTQAVAAITTEPGTPPQAAHYIRLERLLDDKTSPLHPSCIFEEPQFANEISKKLADKFSINYYMLDYLGQGIIPGPDAYFEIMTNLSRNLVKGLS
jgi:zinc transport system substrate-binding protein